MREGLKWIKEIPLRDRKELATAIRDAFEEGYDNYMTPCNAYNSVEDAWEESGAKISYDRLMKDHTNDRQTG